MTERHPSEGEDSVARHHHLDRIQAAYGQMQKWCEQLEEVVDRQDDAILSLETLVFEHERANARLHDRIDELLWLLDDAGIDP